MTEGVGDYVATEECVSVCLSWIDGVWHRCRYKPGHKRRHCCPCGATKSVEVDSDG